MNSTHISGNMVIVDKDGEQTVRHYTPAHNEDVVETPEVEDKTPVTETEREALDKATEPTFKPAFENQSNDRSEVFTLPGEWRNPRLAHAKRKQMMLPNFGQINDLADRLATVLRHPNPPKVVATAATNAREAVDAARAAHEDARHPEGPRFALNQTAKDDVTVKIAEAVQAVSALEIVARESAEAWYAGLVDGLDKQRADAIKALRAAEAAYGALRGSIGAAQSLAVASSKWDGSWHSSPVTDLEKLNAPVGSIRDAIRFLTDGDDFTDGSYLVKSDDYEGVPPHTLARLKRTADLAGGGTFAAQVFARAKSPMQADGAAQDAIEQKRLTLLTSSNPFTADLMGKKSDEV